MVQSHKCHTEGGEGDADPFLRSGAYFIDERTQQRYQDNVEPGEESGLRNGGEAQAGGLQGHAAHQQESAQGAPANVLPGIAVLGQAGRQYQSQRQGGYREAESQEQQGGGLIERVFDDDERDAPDESGDDERQFASRHH